MKSGPLQPYMCYTGMQPKAEYKKLCVSGFDEKIIFRVGRSEKYFILK